MNAIWAVPSLGIDPTTGQEIYVRKDGTLTYEYDAQDQGVAGSSDPKYRGNFGFAAEYKGFGLSATCTFLGGGQRYNTTLVNKVENVDIHYNVDRRVLYGRWQTPGQNAMFKKLGSYTDENGKQHDEKTRATTRFVQDNNELTFSSLSLYNEFNPRLISKIRLKRLKLAFYMNNIATLSSIRIERGTTGGDKFTLKLPGDSDPASLRQRADEELKVRAYTGYEGSFTGWLEPYVEPTWLAEIRDTEYEYKNGSYYVLGVETTFCDKGASRVVTIGKRIENNG